MEVLSSIIQRALDIAVPDNIETVIFLVAALIAIYVVGIFSRSQSHHGGCQSEYL